MPRRSTVYKITGDAFGHGWVSWSLTRHDYLGGVETGTTPLVDCCEFFRADIHELEQFPTHHGLRELCLLLNVNVNDLDATPFSEKLVRRQFQSIVIACRMCENSTRS